jgi:hypothetical protein
MKLKVFLSSRNNDVVVIGGKKGDSLTDIRLFLQKELQKIKLLDEDFLEVIINESFSSSASRDSYNQCLEEVKQSDFTIALYNGAAGWAPPGVTQGICYAELAVALGVSSKKVAVVDIQKFFNVKPSDKAEAARNKEFNTYVTGLNLFMNPLKIPRAGETNDGFKQALLTSIKNIIRRHVIERIKIANTYYNLSGNSPIALDWKKLKYSERDRRIKDILSGLVSSNSNFSDFIYQVHSVPDNMSVDDARSFTGRPFLKDQDIVTGKKGDHAGPLHVVGVYGNASEIQLKNLIGFPDISTIQEDFGIYVWEQNTHIQLVFLTGCKTPEAVNSNFLLFSNWCDTSKEFENVKLRGKARYHILQAINEAKSIVET